MKKIISVLMCLCIVISTLFFLQTTASAEIRGNFEYEILDDGTAEITEYTGYATKVEFPSIIDGYTVTSISGRKYDYGSYTLRYSVFEYCNIPIKSITIPNSVTNIGVYAFSECTSLKSITIPNSITSIGESAFYGCTSLKSITISNNVTSIGGGAFMSCDKLKKVNISSIDSWCNIDFIDCYSNPLIQGADLYLNNKLVANLVIPNTVKKISKFAFGDCTSIKSVTISNNVTSIGNYAFSSCTSLKNIKIPKSVKKIGNYAFTGCTSLKSIKIPKSVTGIGASAFRFCSSLKSIKIPNSVKSIGNGAFIGCKALKTIKIPKSVKKIGKHAYGYNIVADCEPIQYYRIKGLTIKSSKNSAAKKYANKNKIKFVAV